MPPGVEDAEPGPPGVENSEETLKPEPTKKKEGRLSTVILRVKYIALF